MHPIMEARRFCSLHKAAIFTAAGIAAMAVGEILACRQTLKFAKDLEEFHEADESIFMEDFKSKEDEKAAGKAALSNRITLAKCAVKRYAVPAAISVGGMVLVGVGHHINAKRLVMAASAYNSLLAMHNAYRQGVVDEYGEEADRKISEGIHILGDKADAEAEFDVEVVDEDGNVDIKRTEEAFKALNLDPSILQQQYLTVCLNKMTSHDWGWDKHHNFIFVEGQEKEAERQLVRRGELSVGEQLLLLGCDEYVKEHPELFAVGTFTNGHEMAEMEREAHAAGEVVFKVLDWHIWCDENQEFFDNVENNQDQATNYMWVTIPIRGCLFTDGPFPKRENRSSHYFSDGLNGGASLTEEPETDED